MTTSWYLDSPSRFSSSSGESFLSLPSPLAWRSPFDSPVPLSGSFFCVKGPIAEEESLVVCVCARVRVTMLSYPSYFAHGGTSNKAVIRISDWERWPRSSTDEKFPLVVARAVCCWCPCRRFFLCPLLLLFFFLLFLPALVAVSPLVLVIVFV